MYNIGFLSLDFLIIIALIVILFLLCLKFSKKIIVVLTLSMYPTLLIFKNLSFEKFNLEEKTTQAILFIIIYIVLTLILWKNITIKKIHSKTRKIVDYLLLSIVYLVFLISIYINSVDYLNPFYEFSGLITELVSKISYSLMLIIPIAVILITNRKDP